MSVQYGKATAIVSQLSTLNNSHHSKHLSTFGPSPLQHLSALWDTCSTSFPSGFLPIAPGSRCRLRNRVCPWPRMGGQGGLGMGPEETHGRRFLGGRGPLSACPLELELLLLLHRNNRPDRTRWVWRGLVERAELGWG